MKQFWNLIYKVGGYNHQIIKAGQLGPKFLIPGLSLFIVLITSSYGGWHLAETITTGIYRIFMTIGFISLILLVDYILLNGEKSKWTFLLRTIVSITLGFIISMLTTLEMFSKDITANNNANIESQTNSETQQREQEIIFWKSLLSDSIPKYDNLSTQAHKGDYITEDGKRIPRCGAIEQEMSYCRTFARKRDNYQKIYDENKDKIINVDTYIQDTKNDVTARNPDGILGQLENLWQLMMNRSAIFVGALLIFIALMVIDLIPISVKYGIKDSLDNDYQNVKNELKNDKNEDGEPRWYNVEKEKYYAKSNDQKNSIAIKALKQKNQHDFEKFNEESLYQMNLLYAMEKYSELLEYFKERKVPKEAIDELFKHFQKKNKK